MAETYKKKEVVNGKVILTKTVTSDIPKERVLNRLNEQSNGLQSDITRLQAELIEVQAKITDINKITIL